MSKASDIADNLRGSVTASGGVDLRDPQLLRDAADCIERLERYGENMRQVCQALSTRIRELDPTAPIPEGI
jgi:hypothetical protein